MTKLVYLLGPGSKHGDVELRWSLRSVVKFAKEPPEIVLVGTIPEFIDRTKCTCLDHLNDCANKHDNMLAHILHAIDTGTCTEPFLVSSDDHFFVRPVDFANYPVYIRDGFLARECDYGDKPITKYHRSLVDTRNVLEEFGLPKRLFNGHFDTWIFPRNEGVVRSMATVEPRGRYGYEPTALFMNAELSRRPVDCVVREDMKVAKFTNGTDLMREIGDRDSFSISDSAFGCEGFEDWMNAMYGERSEYELEQV